MKQLFASLLLLCTHAAIGQHWQAELQLGIAGYSGDLSQSSLQFSTMRPAAGLNVKYKLNDFVTFRAGVNWGKVTGSDSQNKDSILNLRNLSFQTYITEGSLCAEVNLLSAADYDSYPYLFAGVGIYHFNPFTYDKNDNKVFLHPLSTEGEGFPEYADRPEYKLTQFCIPIGGGVKMKINDALQAGFEIGFRKLFTDYLDDVSKTYVDRSSLEYLKGDKAVEMAYRGTFPQYAPYPPEGTIRGNPKKKDWYYFAGLKLTWTIGAAAE